MNQQEMEQAISQLNHRFLTEDLFTKEQYLIERKKIEIIKKLTIKNLKLIIELKLKQMKKNKNKKIQRNK